MEMEGRYGGRASEKAEGRDTIAMDTGNDVPGGLADGVYNPAPEESSWQGQGGTGGRWGARRSDKAAGRDAEMAYGEELGADSYAAQMQELDDKLKSGMITKAQYDELCAKLENPEAVIDYEKSGYERSGRSKGGMSEDELTPAEKQKFEALKRRRSEGQLSEAENAEFVSLRDKVGRIGFRSAGATRDDWSPEAREAAAKARKMSLSASHPTGSGPKFSASASSHEEAEKHMGNLHKSFPKHHVTVQHHQTGMAHTFKPGEKYNRNYLE